MVRKKSRSGNQIGSFEVNWPIFGLEVLNRYPNRNPSEETSKTTVPWMVGLLVKKKKKKMKSRC
jgi:hypothetical protein